MDFQPKWAIEGRVVSGINFLLLTMQFQISMLLDLKYFDLTISVSDHGQSNEIGSK